MSLTKVPNHCILSAIWTWTTWLHVPCRNSSRRLGYALDISHVGVILPFYLVSPTLWPP